MAEGTVEVTLQDGSKGSGVEVQVMESTERWSETTLEDGAVIRVKMTVMSAVRTEDQYDAQGNPTYLLNMSPVVSIVRIPEQYRKKGQ